MNPITIKTTTRFQVSFDATPPYTKPLTLVAGDGNWSVELGVVPRWPGDPVDEEIAAIEIRGMHNIAPHPNEPAPNPAGYMKNMTGVDMNVPPAGMHVTPVQVYQLECTPIAHGQEPWGPQTHCDKMWVVFTALAQARAWHVEVNLMHGLVDEVNKAARRPKSGCIIPWLPLPMDQNDLVDAGRAVVESGWVFFDPEQRRQKP